MILRTKYRSCDLHWLQAFCFFFFGGYYKTLRSQTFLFLTPWKSVSFSLSYVALFFLFSCFPRFAFFSYDDTLISSKNFSRAYTPQPQKRLKTVSFSESRVTACLSFVTTRAVLGENIKAKYLFREINIQDRKILDSFHLSLRCSYVVRKRGNVNSTLHGHFMQNCESHGFNVTRQKYSWSSDALNKHKSADGVRVSVEDNVIPLLN